MTDNNKKFEVPPGMSNLVMVKAFATIHAATGASAKTIDAAVTYSMFALTGLNKKDLSGFAAKVNQDPELIERIVTEFSAELLDIRRETVRELQAEYGAGLERMPRQPLATRKRRDRSTKPGHG